MCGRYVLHVQLSEITDEFEIHEVDWVWVPNFNIAPGNDIPAVVSESPNRLVTFRWGLIPHWAKEEAIGYKMINARAETIAQKSSFSRALKTQRCIIPANGFYEWRTEITKKRKTPFYIKLHSNRLMGFAGLYDKWKSPDGKVISSCTIITTQPNALLEPLHDRMPAIIEPDKRKIWLDKTIQDPTQLLPLLKPYDVNELEVFEVTSQVNSQKFNNPDCIKPIQNSANPTIV